MLNMRPSWPEWDNVNFALVGFNLGTLAGALFCCGQMVMGGADPHILRDSAIGGVGAAFLLGALSMIRNRITRAKDFGSTYVSLGNNMTESKSRSSRNGNLFDKYVVGEES